MDNPYAVIEQFERRVAEYTGAPYAVAVSSCSAALFLCCKYLKVERVTIPSRTYCSVPAQIMHAGAEVEFRDVKWSGEYQLRPYPIWDSALRLRRDMYRPSSFQCLSFQARKRVPIGEGGMILTDDSEADAWFRLARFSGREPLPVGRGRVLFPGWYFPMTMEQAARGLNLMMWIGDRPPDLKANYPDLRKEPAYRCVTRTDPKS